MSPSIGFWLDTLLGISIGIGALALLLIVFSAGFYKRLNQAFGLFAISSALVGIGSAVANLSFWLDSRVLVESGGFGRPMFWIELAAAGLYFTGPGLLIFGIRYIEDGFGSDTTTLTESTSAASLPPVLRWHKIIAAFGVLVGVALLPAIFGHRIISSMHFGSGDILRLELSRLGYMALIGPLLQQILAMILFWRNRQYPGGLKLAAATAIWLLGSTTVIIVNIPFPIETLTLGISILVTGWIVTSQQIFNPLRTLTHRLENIVAERTRDLEHAKDRLQLMRDQQQRVAQINHELAQITSPSEILTRLAQLIHNRLGYHHIYIYQYDGARQLLNIVAAAGTTARLVLETRHHIQIGESSPAGRAAATRQPLIANAQDAAYLGSTTLSDARSELVVPLLIGDRLMGLLDIQSIYSEAFTDQDLTILTSLADQTSVTLDNARLLRATESALSEVEKVQRQYLGHAWKNVIGSSDDAPAYIYTDGAGVAPAKSNDTWPEEISQAAIQQKALTSDGNGQTENTIALPIVLRGQVIGALKLGHKAGRAWNPEDIATLNEIAERIGVALETARLSEETRRRAAHDQLIGQVSAKMRESLDIDTVLQTAALEMGKALKLHDLTIQLSADEAKPNG